MKNLQNSIRIVTSSCSRLYGRSVNKQIHKELGNNVELLTYGDVTILSDVITYGDVYSKPAAKLISLYSQAIMDGAEAILNTCSSVGEIVDSMQSFADVAGVPIVRIDEEICREAVIGQAYGLL